MAQPEVKVANTKTNEWEELTFVFTGREDAPGGEAFSGVSVFLDYTSSRAQDNVMYFDNITFEGFSTTSGGGGGGDPTGPTAPTTAAPVPTHAESDVIAIFSDSYTLNQNYPNPFNPSTNISFSIKTAPHVWLEVYFVMGQKVATLINGVVNSANHTATFNATDFASGMYLYK